MNRLLELLKNKYFIASLAFVIWMLFFDRNDVVSQYDYRTQVKKLEQEKEFYNKEIAIVEKDLEDLTTDKAKLEKFARERYLMKRDNEDVFVIIEEKAKTRSIF
jgi:cell division protein FtsB